MRKLVTIGDVARLAGVSITTVSRVVSNNGYPVSRLKTERVLAAVAELGYSPSPLARAMVTSHSGIVGVLVGDNADPYFATVVHGIHAAARSAGSITIVCNTLRDPQTELEYLRVLDRYQADGIILAGGELLNLAHHEQVAGIINHYRDHGGRVVALNESTLNLNRVSIDNFKASYDATEYLLDLGHHDIGFVRGPNELRTTLLREEGFRSAMFNRGITVRSDYVLDGGFSFESGFKTASYLFELSQTPTAIVVSSDVAAFGCLTFASQNGISVPNELSIIGMDDVQAALYTNPQLTTVQIPMQQMGMLAVEWIYSDDGDNAVPREMILPHTLIKRGTATTPLHS